MNILNSKWEPLFVHGICIGIKVKISNGYSRALLNTILPETDQDYLKEKKEIEKLVRYVCKLHNKTLKK